MKNRTLLLLTTLISVSVNSVQADSTKLINPDNLHSYKRFDTVTTWPKAKFFCASKGGYLSTITSQAENDWVWSKFGVSPADYIGYIGFWLGGNDSATEGQWTWITGESWSYTNWSPSNPNNDGIQNYLAMWDGKYDDSFAGSWDDGSGHFVASYLCEWNPLKAYTQANIAWVDWTDATSGTPGTATGIISADSEISVAYKGEVAFSYLDGSYPSYSPTRTFSGGTVGNPPTIHDIIALNGGTKKVNTLTFTPAVVDPVLAIWSLGAPGTKASFKFSETLFSIQSGGPSKEYRGTPLKQLGNVISGVEGNGTIQFIGSYTSISWTNPQYEYWYGFTAGVPRTSRAACAFGFSSAEYNVYETTPLAKIKVTRSGAGCPAATVHYSTRAGTAIPGVNYDDMKGILKWNAGDIGTKSFNIPIQSDGVYQQNALTVELTLSNSNPVDNLGSPSTAILTIQNTDLQP